VGCRFSGSHWSQVHFSNCSFKECDFSNATFEDCYFVDDCTFSTISASAQLLKIRDTALSARAFIGNLVTNVDHLPTSVTKEYQLWRHVGTKAKIAKMIFAANKDQAEIAYYFEAYEQLTRCILDQEVEKHHFTADEKPTRRMLFLAKSLPARIERRLVLAAGWLTLWGRSLLRPLVFFAGCIIVFGLLYYCQSATAQAGASNVARARSAVIEAFNITIVAGYTAHYASTASGLRQMTWLLNIACGLFWYSLVIPVISRRILR
jgi:hypothetical protein